MFSGGLHHSLASIEYGDPFLKKKKLTKSCLILKKIMGNLILELIHIFHIVIIIF